MSKPKTNNQSKKTLYTAGATQLTPHTEKVSCR